MAHIENIVIGSPIVDVKSLLMDNEWDTKTLFTDERFLPRILVNLGIFKSTSVVKKNRPDLFRTLNELDCLELKIGRHRLYVIVGE